MAEATESIRLTLRIRDEDSVDTSNEPFASDQERSSSLSRGTLGATTAREESTDTYAEFFRLIGRHKIHVVPPDHYVGLQAGPLGKGGTYRTQWGQLSEALTLETQSLRAKPFVLKTQPGLKHPHGPFGLTSLKAGTVVVSKLINSDTHYDMPNPSDYLSSLINEALVLSHHTIQRSSAFPGLLGFGAQTPTKKHSKTPDQYPFMLLEMGRAGDLEQWFRGMWRAEPVQRQWPRQQTMADKGLRFSNIPGVKVVFSWKRKIHMASSIAGALVTLHRAGVVHGDVKMTNVVGCPLGSEQQPPYSIQFPQLCDLGSCILLSEVAPGMKSKLRSHSPPWNAPESNLELDRAGLLKTDIYSFGLLLARIFLDGNHPFDEDYHVISGRDVTHPREVCSFAKTLQEQDRVIEHVMTQILKPSTLPISVEVTGMAGGDPEPVIRKGCAYTDAQRSVIRVIMQVTLGSSPSSRLGNMVLMEDFLEQVLWANDDELQRLTQFDWNEARLDNIAIQPDNDMSWVQRDSRILSQRDMESERWIPRNDQVSRWKTEIEIDIDSEEFEPAEREHFQDRNTLRYPDERRGIPNLLDPSFRYLLDENLFVRDLFQDIKLQADNGSAEAALQVSWCYLHGWGIERDRGHFRQYFEQAVLCGSLSALENLHLMPTSLSHPFLNPEATEVRLILSRARDALSDALCRRLDLTSAAFLETSFPEDFAALVEKLRTTKKGRCLESPTLLESQHDSESQRLQDACLIGDVDTVEEIVGQMRESAPDAPNATLDLSAPLLQACARGHAYIAMFLLAEGADSQARDRLSCTPLHYLARFDYDMVRNIGILLLNHGASVSVTDDSGFTPLAFVLDNEKKFLPTSVHVAAEFLIENGALIGEQAAILPFAKAALSGDTRLMMLLEQSVSIANLDDEDARKLNVNALLGIIKEPEALRMRKDMAWKHHTLAIQTASSPRRLEFPEVVLRFMHKLESSWWILNIARARALDFVRSIEFFSWPEDVIGPIARCCNFGDLEMARELLRLGAKLDQGPKETNILHGAASLGWPVGCLKALCLGQQTVMELTAMANQPGPLNANPFDVAVYSDHFEIADFLQSLGADTQSAHLLMFDSMESSPRLTLLGFILSKRYGRIMFSRVNAVQYLLKTKPNPIVCPELNLNVFHVVWMLWDTIAKSKIQPEMTDPFDETNKVFEILLGYFIDRNLLNDADTQIGRTPLHQATFSGNIQGVCRLIELGVDINVLDANDETPLDIAIARVIVKTGMKLSTKPGNARLSVSKFVVDDLDFYLFLEICGLLRSHGGVTSAKVGRQDAEVRSIELSSPLYVQSHFDIVIPFDASSPLRDYGYELVQFLPPKHRCDLGSFSIAFISPDWMDRNVMVHPESTRGEVLRGFYLRAMEGLLNKPAADTYKSPDTTYGEIEDTNHFLRHQEHLQTSQGVLIQDDKNSQSLVFHRSDAVVYDKDSDPTIPHLQFEVPFCQRLTKIAFRISSHDQGWSSYRDKHGTYEGSHTWFEVGTLPANGLDLNSSRHLVQVNVHAKRLVTDHFVSWDADTASHELREWLTQLRPGTTVGVFARARYTGWENFVFNMTVELFFESKNGHADYSSKTDTPGCQVSAIRPN